MIPPTGPAPAPVVNLRPTTQDDLVHVVEIEQSAEVKPFVTPWWPEQHHLALADDRYEHLIVVADGELAGYAILDHRPRRFAGVPVGAVDLVRIAVRLPGRGVGRPALRLIADRVLRNPAVPALSLDVLDHNQRARSLYLSEGFVEVGEPIDRLVGDQAGRVMVLRR